MNKLTDRFKTTITQKVKTDEDIQFLEELCTHFPYFQSAFFYRTLGYYQKDSLLFKNSLQALALQTQQRKYLYNTFSNVNESEIEFNEELLIDAKLPNLQFKISGAIEPALKNSPIISDEVLNKTRPAQDFDLEKEYGSQKVNKPNRTSELIEGFLSKKQLAERSNPLRENKALDDESLNVPDDLVSETLAKIYLKQEKFSEAMKVYEKLILLEPEKKVKFARFIEDIKLKLK